MRVIIAYSIVILCTYFTKKVQNTSLMTLQRKANNNRKQETLVRIYSFKSAITGRKVILEIAILLKFTTKPILWKRT